MEKKNMKKCIDTAQLDTSINHTNISYLNDYCLIHIFQYLKIVDRIRIERVCKRWQIISKDSWYNCKEIIFDEYLDTVWGFKNPKDIKHLRIKSLKKVLSRCGRYIEVIDFIQPREKLGPNVLSTVAKFCPNVENIYINEMKFTPESVLALAAKCKRIIELSLGDCTGECDDELALLFERNKNLKDLSFHFNFNITGECLMALNAEQIETITFTNCLNISLKYFSVVKNFKNLKLLSIEHFHDSNNEIIQDISKCSKSLQYLQLSMCPDFSNSLNLIGKLKNLISLDVASLDSVDDDFLMTISENCKQLKNIDISYCQLVTNIGLASILTLPNLTHIAIENLKHVNDEVFYCLPNLESIDCSFCSEMRDDGIARLIEYSENIEHLYLNSCANISNKLIEDAIKFTKKRKNKVVLYVHLSNTNVKLHEINDRSPFLQIIPLIVVGDYE